MKNQSRTTMSKQLFQDLSLQTFLGFCIFPQRPECYPMLARMHAITEAWIFDKSTEKQD